VSSFDFHTISIAVDSTAAEYLEASGMEQGAAPLGMNLGDLVIGDRSKFLSFRHEHAHATSFMATGLMDLHGIFYDYLLTMYDQILRKASETHDPVAIPLIPTTPFGEVSSLPPDLQLARDAWAQVNDVMALLFGFGTRSSNHELTNTDKQSRFIDEFVDSRFAPISERFRALMESLKTKDHDDTSALPEFNYAGSKRRLTARAVMEAYAMTIELMATHFVKMESDLTQYSKPTVRKPGALYTAAIDYALARLSPDITTPQFLAGQAPLQTYYAISLISFSAMQTPVLQGLDGNVYLKGTLDTLSVAHKFKAIVDCLHDGQISPLPDNPKNAPNRNQAIMNWVWECQANIDSNLETLSIFNYVRETLEKTNHLQSKSSIDQSLIDLSWAARANFDLEPVEYIFDAGLFAERYPCQPRIIRTSDNKVIIASQSEHKDGMYYAAYAPQILEAAVYAAAWYPNWEKMPEAAIDDRAALVQTSFLYTSLTFGYSNASVRDTPPPNFRFNG
jgi:hypothetical protein